jgi:8-oxo-dGTP pyrophosphatase MutT (NUDIX family)
MISIPEINRILAVRQPTRLPCSSCTHAAVALILRQTSFGPKVLFIKRAQHENDPWSGNLGFPGGKVKDGDGKSRLTAERETWEELSLELKGSRYLGRLDDITAAHLPIVVSCFVYAVEKPGPFILNEEVAEAFWFPLEDLLDPQRHIEATVHFGGRILSRPAIRLLNPGLTVLWGITYRLVIQFLYVLGYPVI